MYAAVGATGAYGRAGPLGMYADAGATGAYGAAGATGAYGGAGLKKNKLFFVHVMLFYWPAALTTHIRGALMCSSGHLCTVIDHSCPID